MKKVILAFIAVVLVSGCTSTKYNYMPKVKNISEPPIGSVNTAYVGDSLLKQGIMSEYEGIKVTAPARVSWTYTITSGVFKKIGDSTEGEFYFPAGTIDSGTVDKAAIADPWKAIMVKAKTKELCVITAFGVAVCESNMPYEKTMLNVANDNSFQQTLLYNGRVGNKINIGYREASSNMARPAFNNDVEYDLSESKVIGYKGAKVEVMDATNQSIKYKVISNFNNQ
ncbi:lipoprotein [Providencia sp. R33]|uniref:hypothetical protein n=1 Tax=Providencia sp. R33 TaxID=2828763 RepID=UPI001C5B7407|nr:hypothetical protein [Providencia sp. R33]QXX82961.1 lipoprotein [Providencia sp. R33]